MRSNLFVQHLPSAYQPPDLVEKFLRRARARCYHNSLGLQRGPAEDLENKGEGGEEEERDTNKGF